MRRILLLMTVAGAAMAARPEAEPTYVLGIPGVPEMRLTSDSAQNEWLAANTNFVAMSVAATTGGVSKVSNDGATGAARIALASAEAGFPFERSKPDYYLADVVEPPDGVDWNATYEAFAASGNTANFIFDNAARRVFAVKGGTQRFAWTLLDGTVREMTYTIALTCSGRPRRIYWTDYPYNSPGINLAGKFVKFFGNDEILDIRYGMATNSAAGVDQVLTNKVVSGLYLDQSTKMLYAYGQLQGQVVMAYYDTGTYNRLLHVQVVEVCRPEVNRLKGEIGRALKPDGHGYGTEGLRAQPTYVKPSDNRGEYYYQHKGSYSYSPKTGNVYPLRPTKDCPWNMEVYWMETDEMEVDWPFELDQYECDWPADATVFVRGDAPGDEGRSIFLPTEYTSVLMDYQEPEGHARAVDGNGAFKTVAEGYSLLKLTSDDNVWFLPIHSIYRSNTNYFTLASEEIAVGRELKLRTGIHAGTADGFTPVCDEQSPGYIYEAGSAPIWNPNLYIAPAPDEAGGASTNMTAAASSGGDTNKYASVVYAVSANASAPKIEVWWNTTINEEGMPAKITIPTLPQVYDVRWPAAGEGPQIVIASQLGSASESIFAHNMGLRLDDATYATLATRKYFDVSNGGTLMFWTKRPATTPGDAALVSMSASAGGFVVTSAQASTPSPDEWHNIAVVVGTNLTAQCYVDGVASGDAFAVDGAMLSGEATLRLGGGAAGLAFGEISLWNKAFSAEEIASHMYAVHTGHENHLTGLYNFIGGTDLVAVAGGKLRITEKVLGTLIDVTNCSADGNGPPAKSTGVIDADSNTTPKVYVQNDPAKAGYNPNEEHAFVQASSDGHVAWALRSDLNKPDSSAPGVLVEYVKDAHKAMQWFDVVVTNSVYPSLSATCYAGKAFPGPHPIDLLDDPWCPRTTWDEKADVSPVHRDRKGQLWARSAGTATMRMYYRMQDGFAFPSIDSNSWPSAGAEIPWLSLLGGSPSANPLSAAPAVWTWNVSWPENVPEMEIGRTLTEAASGLPEVWNALSMAVVWPANAEERDRTAVLFDPTVAQTAGFSTSDYPDVATVVAKMQIKQGAGGNATLRKGRWYFDNLPPILSNRFYLDTTADVGSCLKLVGEKEDNSAGVSLLNVNVLDAAERETLASLVDDRADKADAEKWREAIAKLATDCVTPSVVADAASDAVERTVEYSPRDHYALFTMGATNYVTLIENDTTNILMGVAQGDPISMHLIKVVPKYYTGRVVTREDPLNLLSQQLSVIYGETFAGRPEDYVFEWRKCLPHADGTVPTDFDGEYDQKFAPTNALTRFVVGAQGDTLANMVNTYYTMRYRAATTNSPSYAAMGYAWSDWVNPPALAEGWVQRVLNNVTPFAQRMRDLVENQTETAVSMVRQAGRPYEGDVALNNDNLSSVGLIQLYETILSKAESMSLQMGINDIDANKQLQLAAARLADLYNVLGDEAWTDALNPTIGFGSNFDTTAMTGFELDYGALSSALFAFDNQVPTLLDEELALLRGRSGDNAPATTISPYYNRLVWNFTKGITAGEVAYAVNYDISGNNKGIIDESDAADMYPQGHGDAYGHYLSALSGYYRLLRNPYFSWGEPAMGEMVVADAVLNVDYYDEAQFAKAAYNVAKVAEQVVDRTARKAYRDNGSVSGAGYLDDDKTRNFGYGEWASRGGYGALCNWAVANAILEESPTSGKFYRYRFNGDVSSVWTHFLETDAPYFGTNTDWTVEFQIVPGEQESQDPSMVLTAMDKNDCWVFGVVTNKLMFGELPVSVEFVTNTVYNYTFTNETSATFNGDYRLFSATNGTSVLECVFFGDGALPSALPENYDLEAQLRAGREYPEIPRWDGWTCAIPPDAENGNVAPYVYTDVLIEYKAGSEEIVPKQDLEICELSKGENFLVVLRCAGGVQSVSVFNAAGALLASKTIEPLGSLSPEWVFLGGGYTGEIGELRLWEGVARTDAELRAKREYVSPISTGLALYLRTISKSETVQLVDDAESSAIWNVIPGEWIAETESGMDIDFKDEGLSRIDRSTVHELDALAGIIPSIQKMVDRMDAGLNPLGLAAGAIPFDLTPVGEGDEAKTHFEQIRERAGTALDNARKALDKAQFYASRLRLMQETHVAHDNLLDPFELETKNQLIEYFGYPYEGDIGPGGTYAQGYDGPDLLHYMWMEPEKCGLSADEDVKSISTNTYMFAVDEYMAGGAVKMYNFYNKMAVQTNVFEKSAAGIVVKPSYIKGKRRAQGSIQDALGDLLAAYGDYKVALDAWRIAVKQFDYENTTIWSKFARDHALMILREAQFLYETVQNWAAAADQIVVNTLETAEKLQQNIAADSLEGVPRIVGAGMTVNTDPHAIAAAAVAPANIATKSSICSALVAAKNSLVANDAVATGLEIAVEAAQAASDYTDLYDDYYQRMLEAAEKVNDAALGVREAFIALQTAQAAVETVVAEAERVIETRTLIRQQASDTLTKARYNEMFFRVAYSSTLSRYSTMFDLAQKYTYLAAQAYDYETGLISSDKASGEKFIAKIVGARTLGQFDDDGGVMVSSDIGDGGLSDILARLDQNWLVLKPRLGINNPQNYATWFSLRDELFRIHDDERGDKAWRTELKKYVVDDLNDVPAFRRFCQPLPGGSAAKEPGLVIPFSTEIVHGRNFFGKELTGGDSSLDPTYYASHIASVGVHFENYDDSTLSKTPKVYLIPAGEDRMRAVGDPDTILSWRVVDQTIPAPYAIGSTKLDDPDWAPLYDGNTGGNDVGAKIRKHPSFLAYYDDKGKDPSDDSLDSTRLVGRSAWNTKWLLVIPAGTMDSDRYAALSAFIDGVDSDRDGTLDFSGVRDIKLGLKTYSTSGN